MTPVAPALDNSKPVVSADWMRALFEAIDDAVFVHDHAGNILEANTAACRRLGYTREELLELNTRDIDDPDFAAGFKERLATQINKSSYRFEGLHRTKDGRVIPVDINTSAVFLQGKPAILAVMRDISQQKLAEDALRDSEVTYHSLVESLPQNIFRKDLAGRVTFANKHYCETLKLPLEQLVGKTDFDLFPPELAAKYVEDDRRVLENGNTPFETVEAHHLPQGGTIYVQVVKTPVYDAQGNIIGIQGIFWDVTERKRAEEFLSESERRYRQLTEATLDGIVLIDESEVIRLFNPAAERMFGHQAAELIGRPAYILVSREARPSSGKGFFRILHKRQPHFIGRAVEITALRADGTEFPVEIAVNLITFKGGLPGGGDGIAISVRFPRFDRTQQDAHRPGSKRKARLHRPVVRGGGP